mmetsp:Transcript_15458/g.25823  ORF Transcript_15458/g.25823 Transcript_15458/m.25823 type:complete len:260 (-) Transcript_15458:1115-1894(-)
MRAIRRIPSSPNVVTTAVLHTGPIGSVRYFQFHQNQHHHTHHHPPFRRPFRPRQCYRLALPRRYAHSVHVIFGLGPVPKLAALRLASGLKTCGGKHTQPPDQARRRVTVAATLTHSSARCLPALSLSTTTLLRVAYSPSRHTTPQRTTWPLSIIHPHHHRFLYPPFQLPLLLRPRLQFPHRHAQQLRRAHQLRASYGWQRVPSPETFPVGRGFAMSGEKLSKTPEAIRRRARGAVLVMQITARCLSAPSLSTTTRQLVR